MAHLITGNKFDPNTDIPDLSGKVYVVTGGSAGIGYGIVAHLLQHKASKILLLSKKEEHADEAIESLKQYGDSAAVQWFKCDLADLKQTDEVAKHIHKAEPRIDALILNAGLGVGKYWETKDGLDSHFQVNHLAQMHLALILLPNLQSTPHSRLVLQSSDLHRGAPPSTKFSSITEINTDVGPTFLYNRTKLAQVLFVLAFKRRMDAGQLGFKKDNIVYVNAVHPGGVNTDQPKQAEEAYGKFVEKVAVPLARTMMKDPIDEGCRPALFAAASGDIIEDNVNGQYIVPDRKVTSPSSGAQNEALGEQLWKLSEQILQEKLGVQAYMSSTDVL
ncbi:MAG: hypothetical protein M1835_001801 [Candelina submexicana]|nr:MAG: hypothetical protein M1835_001801 [Candelina submexicana]